MSFLLRGGRQLGTQAVKVNSLLSLVSHRQYVAPSSSQQQVTSSEAVPEGGCPLKTSTVRPTSEIPGPRRLPLVGSFLTTLMDKDFKRDKQYVYWRKMRKEYGDVVRFDFPGMGSLVLLFNADDIEHLVRITMNNPVREGTMSLRKVREEAADNYFEDKPGLLTTNNEEWYRVRSRVQTPMMKAKNVTAYLTQMDQVTLDFMDRVAAFQKDLGEMPSSFQIELYKWSLESVSLVALNRRLGCLSANLPSDSVPMKLIEEANNIMKYWNDLEMGFQLWRFFPTPSFKKMKESHNEFLRVADENIRQTEAQLLANKSNLGDDLTLMETLLLTPGLSRKDVVTLIVDMMFAGIDTTANTIAFTLYLLSKHPEVQTKLHEEIDSVVGDTKGPLTSKHLGQLSYLKAIVKESLRLYPLIPGVTRTLETDTVFGGYLIPKGFLIGAWNMFIGEDENIFPRAKEFIPERWLRDRPLGHIHAYASMPFGLGTRMCVGRRIAEQEIYTFLTRAMQRFSVDYKYKDLEIVSRLVNVPSEPLRFEFHERR